MGKLVLNFASQFKSGVIFLILLTLNLSLFAQENHDVLLKISNQPEDTVKVRLYSELHAVYSDFDEDKALESLEMMRRLSQRLDYQPGIDSYYRLKGLFFYDHNYLDSALYYHRLFYKSNTVQKSFLEKAKTANNIGLVFQQTQQYDSALVYFSKVLDGCDGKDCSELYCAVLNNMGMTVYGMGNTEKSVTYFEEAYSCLIESGETAYLPQVVNNLASLYALTGKENADDLFLSLLNDSAVTLSVDERATVFLNLGGFYFRSENNLLAEKYFLIADSMFTLAGPQTNPEITHSLGSINKQNKKYRTALNYFFKVNTDFPNYNQREMLYVDIAETYFNLENYDSAKYYYEHLLEFKDSLAAVSVEEALIKAQNNLDFVKKDAEINELKLGVLLQQESAARNRIITISLVSLLVLLLMITFLYLSKEKQKRKIKELVIAAKNKKLIELAQKIEQRNQAIEEIEKRFEDYKETTPVREQLKADVIESMQISGDGETFGLYFEDQHKGFYEELKRICPSLTNNDLRLCSLTKLRMSLKETAEVLNLSVDAVKSGRYRLRKKLNLTNEIDLSDFFNSL